MIIEKSVIAPKLAKLKMVLPSKLQENAIQGVLFKENSLSATNLEMGVKTPLDVNTDEVFIIPARAIELIDSLPDGSIEIIPEDNHSITIKAQNIKNKFQSFDPEVFPEVNTLISDVNVCSISSVNFERAVKSVIYAVDANNTRTIMTGIYFDSSGGNLNIVGCDGYRIAWYKMPYNKDFTFVIPKMAIQKLLSIGLQGDIEISYGIKSAIFKTDEYTVYTRLLDGSYIEYKRMFTKQDNSAIIGRMAFLEGLRRCMICMDEKNRGVVKLQFEEDTLTITANSTISEYAEKIKLEAPIDKPIAIGFNGTYLIDCLRSFDCENIELSFGSAVQPMIADDGEQSALVLPVRLN